MEKRITELVFILDKSGSMEHIRTATIANFNDSLFSISKSVSKNRLPVASASFSPTVLLPTDGIPHIAIFKVASFNILSPLFISSPLKSTPVHILLASNACAVSIVAPPKAIIFSPSFLPLFISSASSKRRVLWGLYMRSKRHPQKYKEKGCFNQLFKIL